MGDGVGSNSQRRVRAERTVIAQRRTDGFTHLQPQEDPILQKLRPITDSENNTYILLEKVGQGARGTVYKAVDTNSSRYVAIKFLLDEFCHDQDSLDLFFHEFRILKGLNHKNIVYSIADGVLDDKPFFVMEYMNGRDLSQLLSATGPLHWRYALTLLTQICAGLEITHRIKILHRDIKLGNLFLVDGSKDERSLRLPSDFVAGLMEHSLKQTISFEADYEIELSSADIEMSANPDQVVKIIDFGFAVDEKKAQEQRDLIIGTPQYMAPEMFEGEGASYSSEIYSVGAVGFKLLTGRAPFEVKSTNRTNAVAELMEFRRIHKKQLPLPPYPEFMTAPADVKLMLQKALNRTPNKRFTSIAELKEEMELCLQFSQLGWIT